MKKSFIPFCIIILLAGCLYLVASLLEKAVLLEKSEPSQITKTVLEYWKNGDYETPKKFWDEKSLQDYSYLSNIDSYKLIRERRLAYFDNITIQVKFKAKSVTTVKKLYLFNFVDIASGIPPANKEWRIFLVEEAENYLFFFTSPKGKTRMSLPKY